MGLFHIFFSFLLVQGKCCGISDYNDFKNAQMFQKNKTTDQVIPVSCCKLSGSPLEFIPVDASCTRSPNDSNSYFTNVH